MPTPKGEAARSQRTASKTSRAKRDPTASEGTAESNGHAVGLDVHGVLKPYLIGDGPDPAGEWTTHCPLHHDQNPSASFNLDKGVWVCRSRRCESETGLGRVDVLAARLARRNEGDGFVPDYVNGARPRSNSAAVDDLPSKANLDGWVERLLADKPAFAYLTEERGLPLEVIKRFGIGLKTRGNADDYAIPVRDERGHLVNVRYRPRSGEPKA